MFIKKVKDERVVSVQNWNMASFIELRNNLTKVDWKQLLDGGCFQTMGGVPEEDSKGLGLVYPT